MTTPIQLAILDALTTQLTSNGIRIFSSPFVQVYQALSGVIIKKRINDIANMKQYVYPFRVSEFTIIEYYNQPTVAHKRYDIFILIIHFLQTPVSDISTAYDVNAVPIID